MKLVSRKYAAIDLGSNAIRLLIMNVHHYKEKTYFKKISLTRVPIRLGEDAFLYGNIADRNRHRLMHAMKAFYHLMQLHEISGYRACATSAMRDSKNGKQIVQDVLNETGINIEIIDGKTEAEIIYATHIEELLNPYKNYIYIDVGGGSTEITLYSKGQKISAKSFNIGTIRILHDLVEHTEWDLLQNWLKTHTQNLNNFTAIGSGGNINRLYKMAGKNNWKPLKYSEIRQLKEKLASYSYEERVTALNLNIDRADVIIPASNIFIATMKWAKVKEVIVPKMGLSDGLVRYMYEADVKSGAFKPN